MRLIPLKQWICDSCGEVIEKPEDGWLDLNGTRTKWPLLRVVSALSITRTPACTMTGNWSGKAGVRTTKD